MVVRSIFKEYDVRGLYPSEINEESIGVVARALASIFNPGSVVVAHDGRHGSSLLAQVIKEKIEQYGETVNKKFEVIFVGLATTPMFYFLVNNLKAVGGAMITASHNPKEYNGVKVVRETALLIGGKELLKVIEDNNYGS